MKRKINIELFNYQLELSSIKAKYMIVPKGRRLGATFWGASDCMYKCVNDSYSILWGDVTYDNINAYVDMYFLPILKQGRIPYNWDKKAKKLSIGRSYIDFRSAQYPEHWEGFGYRHTFLNEAGIILKNRDLYEKSVQPMMLDYPDSTLVAIGTPKGIKHKGKPSKYHELFLRALEDKTGRYWCKTYTTFDNPEINRFEIDDYINSVTKITARQEIYGEFVDIEESKVSAAMINWYEEPPENMEIYTGVDLAISQKEEADYTAIVTIGIKDGNIYVLDAWRGKWQFHETLKNIEKVAAAFNPISINIESVQYQAAVVQELLRTTRLNTQGVKPIGEKVVRFQALVSRYEQGLVHHNAKHKEFTDEILAFPSGEHDDFVDAFVYAYTSQKKKTDFTIF